MTFRATVRAQNEKNTKYISFDPFANILPLRGYDSVMNLAAPSISIALAASSDHERKGQRNNPSVHRSDERKCVSWIELGFLLFFLCICFVFHGVFDCEERWICVFSFFFF